MRPLTLPGIGEPCLCFCRLCVFLTPFLPRAERVLCCRGVTVVVALQHQLCLSARSRHGSFLKVPNKHCFGRGLTSTFIFSEPACPFRHGHACAQFPSEDRQGSRGGPPAPALLWVQRPGRRCMCPPSALTHGAGVGSGVEAEAEVVGPVHSRRSVQSVFPRSSYRQRVLRSSVSCFLPSVLLLCCPLAGPSVSSHI